MLSIQKIKELLNNRDMPDKEVEEIRDGLHNLAEIIYEKWLQDEKIKRDTKI